ncbi:MAG: hypothetical protein IPK82_33125 [Polyangiaceae bacterium]|nr:hypothetical protein [Polyangiaceae bacterium]
MMVGAQSPDGRRWPGIKGIWGHVYIDVTRELNLEALPEIHEEVCLALAQLPLDMTGGSHRSMGIMPASRVDEALVDYVEVIRSMGPAEVETLRSLADDPRAWEGVDPQSGDFGEERKVPLSRRQLAWLKVRHGVYFPWKGYVELIPNRLWTDKSSGTGKTFTRTAQAFFPKTIAFVKTLPFVEVGRCNVMGLEAFDYGTVHRDGDPAEQKDVDHFITIVPGGDKELFLWDETLQQEVRVNCQAYWFNDFDYHGVVTSNRFRYSIRVDGRFDPSFLERIERTWRGR